MNIWFTSDEHFLHTNIIKYCNRPFSNATEMDETIIQRHNELVKPGDQVYHLGDISFQYDGYMYIHRLNGQHFLLKGNHDKSKNIKLLPNLGKNPFQWIKDTHMLKTGEHAIWMSHYCHFVWPESHKGSLHLFGHSHGTLTSNPGKSMDVGVDTNNFYPYHLDEVVEILSKKNIAVHDHHSHKEYRKNYRRKS